MVPNGWEVRELNEICSKTISYGIVQTGPEVANGIPCIRVVDLSKKHMNTSDMIKTSEKIHQSYKKTILEKDELVMALRGEIGLVRIIEDDLSGINITRGIARLAPKKNWVVPDFLLWAMRSYEVKKDLSRKSGGSALQEISLTALRKVKITLPPLPEQQKIAKILATWDKAIDTTERLIDNSKQQKKALMQQLLTGKKRLLEDNGKSFEGEWKESKLEEWIVEYKEKSTEENQFEVYTSSRDGLVLQSEYFAGSRISSRSNIGFHVLLPHHITYRSRSDDGFFTFNLFENDTPGLISNYYPVFTTKGDNYFFISLFEQFRAKFGKYSVGTSQKVLSFNALKEVVLSIPSVEEQQKIAAVLTNADKEIELLEQQLADLQQEKKALMQVLLTGKKRVLVDGAVV